MVSFNNKENQLIIRIPSCGIEDLMNYQKSILGVLNTIEIENCDPELKENLKVVYELLSHLRPEQDLHSERETSFSSSNQTLAKN